MIVHRGTDWHSATGYPVLHYVRTPDTCKIYYDPADRTALCPGCARLVLIATLHGSFGGVVSMARVRIGRSLTLHPVARGEYWPCGCTYYPYFSDRGLGWPQRGLR